MNGTTLIVGSGDCATRVAELLVAANQAVIVASRAEEFSKEMQRLPKASSASTVELLTPARLLACQGFVGQYEASLDIKGETLRRRVATVVIAEDCRRHVNFDVYGLKPTENVRSLSDFIKQIKENHEQFSASCEGKHALFLNGLYEENTPIIFKEVVHSALKLQALPHTRTTVLSANLKVADNGLEALYQRAKQAGTLFFKFASSRPSIRQLGDGRVEVTYQDETTGHNFTLTPDLTVTDEHLVPSEYLRHLGRLFELHTDPLGFLQTENVHRYSVFTNRKGILVCGTSRGPMGPSAVKTDAAEAVAAVRALHQNQSAKAIEKARIDTGQCIKCLTCYRLCPYRSIQKGLRMNVVPEACEGCGICAAECPRGAIVIGDETQHYQPPMNSPDSEPSILAFCCSRSAARAKELAECSGFDPTQHVQIIELPCGGSLAAADILGALAGGVAGVLVMTCHEGNCHSETGNILARRRVNLLREQLQQIGALDGRLEFHTLAANMATEFGDIVRRFEKKIKE